MSKSISRDAMVQHNKEAMAHQASTIHDVPLFWDVELTAGVALVAKASANELATLKSQGVVGGFHIILID